MTDVITPLLARTRFSFLGTILELRAATMDWAVDERTAIARIDYVLHAPDYFVRTAGQKVTLQLASNDDIPAVGQTLAFFVEGRVFCTTLGLLEIARLPVAIVSPYVAAAQATGIPASAFNKLLSQMQQDELKAHMQGADALVVGKVVALVKDGPWTVSEHDPDWWRATIDVQYVEHGDVGPGRLDMLFANSMDVCWYGAPKAGVGQSGAWLLHRTKDDLQTVASFQILHADDYLTTQQLDVLRQGVR